MYHALAFVFHSRFFPYLYHPIFSLIPWGFNLVILLLEKSSLTSPKSMFVFLLGVPCNSLCIHVLLHLYIYFPIITYVYICLSSKLGLWTPCGGIESLFFFFLVSLKQNPMMTELNGWVKEKFVVWMATLINEWRKGWWMVAIIVQLFQRRACLMHWYWKNVVETMQVLHSARVSGLGV